MSRRGLLKATAAGLSASAVSSLAALEPERRLRFRHTHTNEELDVVYWKSGNYLPHPLEQIDYLLRDFRTNETHSIDTELLDTLHLLYVHTSSQGHFEIISAYRSPATNEMLRSKSKGVAKRSMHMLGKAIDVRLSDAEVSKIRDAAYALRRGGVGYYAKSNFLHVDSGRFRTW